MDGKFTYDRERPGTQRGERRSEHTVFVHWCITIARSMPAELVHSETSSLLLLYVKRDIFHEWIRSDQMQHSDFLFFMPNYIFCLRAPQNYQREGKGRELSRHQKNICDKRDPINSSRKIIKRFIFFSLVPASPISSRRRPFSRTHLALVRTKFNENVNDSRIDDAEQKIRHWLMSRLRYVSMWRHLAAS